MTTGRINQVARRYPRGCGARAFREKGRNPDRADPRTSPTSRSLWRALTPFVRRGERAGRAVFAAHSHLRCQGEAAHRATRKDRLADWCFSGRKQDASHCAQPGARVAFCETGCALRERHTPQRRKQTTLASTLCTPSDAAYASSRLHSHQVTTHCSANRRTFRRKRTQAPSHR